MSNAFNGVRQGHGVKPDSWTNDAILSVPKQEAPTSWWLNQVSREAFQATARAQQTRLRSSRFGNVALHDKWTPK